ARKLGRLSFAWGPRFFVALLLGFVALGPAWWFDKRSWPCFYGMALFWPRGFGICCDCLDRTNWRCAAFGRNDPVLECRAMGLWKFEMAGRYRFVRASSMRHQPNCAVSLPIWTCG